MKKINQKIRKENIDKLSDIYKYVYKCEKCGLRYGSDKKESGPFLCPICEEPFKKRK